MLVALINEEMARRYWSGRDPIGGRIRVGGGNSNPWVTVVGIVADVKHNGLTAPVKEKFYLPHPQWDKATGFPIRGMTLVVKTTGDPAAQAATVRQELRAMDPSLPVADVRTMADVLGSTLSAPRFTGLLLGIFAALALVLSAIGIFGVLSYLVSRRTREIGIRVAIGAGRGEVLRLVLQQGLVLALVGVVIGMAAAASLTRLMRGLLHGVTPGDPLTFVFVGLALSLVAVLASAVPGVARDASQSGRGVENGVARRRSAEREVRVSEAKLKLRAPPNASGTLAGLDACAGRLVQPALLHDVRVHVYGFPVGVPAPADCPVSRARARRIDVRVRPVPRLPDLRLRVFRAAHRRARRSRRAAAAC